MKRVISYLSVVVLIALVACESNTKSKSYRAENPNLREVVVKEIEQTSSYTYLKLKEEGSVYWAAISRRDDVEKGSTYYFDNFMEMKNFPSKELDKTFESIYFIEDFSDKPFPAANAGNMQKTGSAVYFSSLCD